MNMNASDSGKDSELETWAKFGPLSKKPFRRYTGDYKDYDLNEANGKRVSGKQAYEALASLLMRPHIKLSRGGDTYYVDSGIGGKYIQGVVATVSIPAFEVGKGSLDLRVTRQHDALGPDVSTGWSKQVPIKPVRIVQIKDAKTNNIIGLEYHYRPQDKYYAGERDNIFRAKACVTTSDSFRIPAFPPAIKESERDTSYIIKDSFLDGRPPGWVYAEDFDT